MPHAIREKLQLLLNRRHLTYGMKKSRKKLSIPCFRKKTKCDEYFHYCFFEGAVFALELLIIDTTYIAVKCNGSKQQQRLNSHGHFNKKCAYKCVY